MDTRLGIEIRGWLPYGAVQLGIRNSRGNRDRFCTPNSVLQRKDTGEITVVALGPDMFIGLGLDQLRGNAHPVSALSHRAFQNIADAARAADPLHIGGLAL